MFLDSVGIILKKNELSPYKIIILDKIQGKIECVTTATSLSTGALITYNMRQKGSMHFISDSTLVYIPLSLAQTDMLFFHHVLELIYYFTHVGNCSKEVFDLLAFLYSTEHRDMTTQSKKFFLLKLLTSMGSVPEINEVRTKLITQLNTIDIKQLSHMTINTLDEKELDRWLWCCVWQHPYVNEFKTVHFLAHNRAI
ncbi:MAG TPA: hypothetical protein VJ201_07035 [Candidatus Babeliales bacterium]|nr:hypothetical protein [Candidatus Babeliales bacterium]HLC07093.1 hypothetical protein [Candidatus Babeliales bacterium]